jgi:recombinational DNA repair protein RecT
VFFEEIDMKQMDAIEKSSRAGSSGPWKGPFKTEMMRKSTLRRLLKYRVPSSTDLDNVVHADDEMYSQDKPDVKPAETTSSRLRDIVSTTAEVGDSTKEELPI